MSSSGRVAALGRTFFAYIYGRLACTRCLLQAVLCALCSSAVDYLFTLFTNNSTSQLSADLGATAGGCHAALPLSWCLATVGLGCLCPATCLCHAASPLSLVLCAFHAVLLLYPALPQSCCLTVSCLWCWQLPSVMGWGSHSYKACCGWQFRCRLFGAAVLGQPLHHYSVGLYQLFFFPINLFRIFQTMLLLHVFPRICPIIPQCSD